MDFNHFRKSISQSSDNDDVGDLRYTKHLITYIWSNKNL